MTKEITLHIKAKDIRTTNYLDCSQCAITRALRRAGFRNWEDAGDEIQTKDGMLVHKYTEEQTHLLVHPVQGMYFNGDTYRYPRLMPYYREPQDFSVTLTITLPPKRKPWSLKHPKASTSR